MGHPRFTKEEIAERADAIYDAGLRQKVESEEGNIGKFLVIDIETGEYEIDRDELPAIHRLRSRHPEGAFFLYRIGYSAAHKLGGGWRRQPAR